MCLGTTQFGIKTIFPHWYVLNAVRGLTGYRIHRLRSDLFEERSRRVLSIFFSIRTQRTNDIPRLLTGSTGGVDEAAKQRVSDFPQIACQARPGQARPASYSWCVM